MSNPSPEPKPTEDTTSTETTSESTQKMPDFNGANVFGDPNDGTREFEGTS